MVRLEERCVLHFSQTLMSINLHMWNLMASHILYHLGQWVYCQTVDMWLSTLPRFDFHFYPCCKFFWLVIACAILKRFLLAVFAHSVICFFVTEFLKNCQCWKIIITMKGRWHPSNIVALNLTLSVLIRKLAFLFASDSRCHQRWLVLSVPEQVGAQTSVKTVESARPSLGSKSILQKVVRQDNVSYISKSWMALKEPIGIWGENNFTFQGLLEHLNVTKDRSDYLWHKTR